MFGHSLKALWIAGGAVVVAGTVSAVACVAAAAAVAVWLTWGRA
jgi:hypothetical protein